MISFLSDLFLRPCFDNSYNMIIGLRSDVGENCSYRNRNLIVWQRTTWTMLARDIMDVRFHTVRPTQTVAEAVKVFEAATIVQGKRIFGLMVTDDQDRLVGMLSMYDILLFVQPKQVHLWDEMEYFEPGNLLDELLDRVKAIQVRDIMTTEVVTIKPDTHIIAIADLMIKRHIRRLPVVEGKDVVGIVYISDLFYHLMKRFL
jgi:CBS domain-containing protein